MKLTKATVHKYKCIDNDQSFAIEDGITVLVGMNESGKTSVLEALAKSNYFQDDAAFKFNLTHDYPRREKKRLDKSGTIPVAVTCTFEIGDDVSQRINEDIGEGVFTQNTVTCAVSYNNKRTWNDVKPDFAKFLSQRTAALGIGSKALNDKVAGASTEADIDNIIAEYKDEGIIKGLKELKKYFKNQWKWANDPLSEYVARVHLTPDLPKFLYYDEYYALPSRISIEKLTEDELDDEELKTAKALFELADINVKELLNAKDFENFTAELEATQAIISGELFKYWETNKNIEIEFRIDKVEGIAERMVPDPQTGRQVKVSDNGIVEHVLDIRVKNRRTGVSLPLRNRSKGFNWFFSFLVWFKKIQEDEDSKYILLLDEPGLNLHAAAQHDLLNFLKDLSEDYQIVFTTHSPFMIASDKLHTVRTVVETENGSVVSDSVQEKDPNTLFPLQAALGYDIAQNLFVSKHNLLVEGVSDLVYLQTMSGLLDSLGRTGLDNKITIVPTGGLDKVTTFISLLRGSDLAIACLLDSFTDQKGKARMEDLIEQKIIASKRIRFFHEFIKGSSLADIEDMFTKADYLKLYNAAFAGSEVKESDLDSTAMTIIAQISKHLGLKKGFNHYRPANRMAADGVGPKTFEGETLDRFEAIFKSVNALFA